MRDVPDEPESRSAQARSPSSRLPKRSWRCRMLREGMPIGVIVVGRGRGAALHRQADRAPRRPSPTRRSSRSRTCGCSTRRKRRSSSRRPRRDPAGDRELADRRRSRCSTPSPQSAARLCGASDTAIYPARRRARSVWSRRHMPARCAISAPEARSAISPRHSQPAGRCSTGGRVHVEDIATSRRRVPMSEASASTGGLSGRSWRRRCCARAGRSAPSSSAGGRVQPVLGQADRRSSRPSPTRR